MSTISVAVALNDLKLIKKRITDKTQALNAVTVGVSYPSTQKQIGLLNEFKNKAKADFQSILALQERYSAIKEAIVLSNATTEVEIGGKVYTVAGAIEFKSRVEMQQSLINVLSTSLRQGEIKLERANTAFEEGLNKLLLTLAGNDKSQVKDKDSESVAPLVENYTKINQQELIDPLHLKTELARMQAELDLFKSSVDNVLTHSNVVTLIKVPD